MYRSHCPDMDIGIFLSSTDPLPFWRWDRNDLTASRRWSWSRHAPISQNPKHTGDPQTPHFAIRFGCVYIERALSSQLSMLAGLSIGVSCHCRFGVTSGQNL